MKKLLLIFVIFFSLNIQSSFAQSVRINFIRYKQIEYNNYLKEWEEWPDEWNESGAYAIIKKIHGETYKVSLYSYNDEFLAASTCTFDPEFTYQKRKSQNLKYLNCYTDKEDNQIWTNIVSLESLIQNNKNWEQDDADMYFWIFNITNPIAFVME